ncbi:uncharacterized protein LOC113371152 [Ctenocephalides felis]|uniref:uncharacterized protein LOC113371152 n=1 Tax=Ctenocephalides felis TaxID=7515 RepID=UPI000E6E31F3|nr:uncharacterized protein LOC113371152 [Ctenocephalides felis]
MENQNILIEKRRSAKSKITRTQNYISKFDSELSISELNARKQLLNDAFNKYNEAQDELEMINLDEFEGDRDEIETQYCKILSTIDNLLAGCRQRLTTEENITDQLKQFWEIEELNERCILSQEELRAEDIFEQNVSRDSNGRFEVALPFRSDPRISLGSTYSQAYKRFMNLEKRLTNNKKLAADYDNFIREYIRLGHATKIDKIENRNLDKHNYYYLPHHAIVREASLTTKLRVVFDASAKSSNGLSLNDILLPGPRLQKDLFTILIRFRTHRFVFTADIVKMFRQIKIKSEHQDYQRILWREAPGMPVGCYKLNTVTYGTNCAPYLAMKCLEKLAIDYNEIYPKASKILQSDCYVDDIISGADTLQEAKLLITEINNLLAEGGFELHKWSSNNIELINDKNIGENINVGFDKEKIIKTLGVIWQPTSDNFKIYNNVLAIDNIQTKRKTLASIASIFDPLGFITPVVITSKLIMQQLWRENKDWDEPVTENLLKSWQLFSKQLEILQQLTIPRQLNLFKTIEKRSIHGFADASMKAYGACLYLCVTYQDGTCSSKLICSKSRVAPLKQITLPRLELCAALLLARLFNKVSHSLEYVIKENVLWSDSSITLSWLNSEPCTWQIFVANRVSEIQKLTSHATWKHVPSKENPADLISRGITPLELQNSALWWNGPDWLANSNNWPKKFTIPDNIELPDKRKLVVTLVATQKKLFSFNL